MGIFSNEKTRTEKLAQKAEWIARGPAHDGEIDPSLIEWFKGLPKADQEIVAAKLQDGTRDGMKGPNGTILRTEDFYEALGYKPSPTIQQRLDDNLAAQQGLQTESRAGAARIGSAANTFANAENAAADQGFQSVTETGAYTNDFNQANQEALAGYMGATDPLMNEIKAGGYTDMQSSAADIARQQDALAQYKSLSTPGVTAAERLMSEEARLKQEQQDRASRDAVMGDLKARGMGGSGAELTNMLGAQQLTGQNRVLAELGAQANAVNRSMSALEGYTGQANSIRTANDAIMQANKAQSMIQQRAREAQQVSEATRMAGLAGERATAQSGVAKEALTTNTAQSQAAAKQAADAAAGKGRVLDARTKSEQDMAKLRGDAAAGVAGAQEKIIGYQQGEAAAKAAKDEADSGLSAIF